MKKVKILLFFLVIVLCCDLALLFVDDGNHLETIEYNATVLSCEPNKNSGLDTYYTVKYEYTNNEGNKVEGTDNYYHDEVKVGSTITVGDKVTVKGEYADLLFYISVAVSVVLGVLAFLLVLCIVKLKEGANK